MPTTAGRRCTGSTSPSKRTRTRASNWPRGAAPTPDRSNDCARTRPEDLAAQLDDWAYSLRLHREDLDWKKLQQIALLSDADPFRQKIRRAVLDEKPDEILRVAADADPEKLSAANLVWLASNVAHIAGDREAGQGLLREGVRLHPGHWGLRYSLASSLFLPSARLPDEEEIRECIVHSTAAIALRPKHSWAWLLREAAGVLKDAKPGGSR